MSQHWQPAADQQAIKARARLLKTIRAFFDARDYLEVDTPILAGATVTDPNIESIAAEGGWLQTSPEFAMKRMLASGSGPIYQIAHAFRKEELGRWHNSEFSLLEWYVPGYDHQALMTEMEELLQHLCPQHSWPRFARIPYRQAFLDACSLDPFEADLATVRACVAAQGIDLGVNSPDGSGWCKDDWLDLLMAEVIGPGLGLNTPCFIVDYPPSQAALARIRQESVAVASRFELYWQGIELANGFHELADAQEQQQRFIADLQTRAQAGKPQPTTDEYLLAALAHGLPDCSGVALGLDRLLALMLGRNGLETVLSFPADRI
ncbi:MAG: EF-P lysine aminoacylase EpmA [Nevskiales bacterium]